MTNRGQTHRQVTNIAVWFEAKSTMLQQESQRNPSGIQLETIKLKQMRIIGQLDIERICLALYVDELFSKSGSALQQFLELFGKVFEIRVSNPNYFVGLEIEREGKRIKIHQTAYVRKLVEKFNLVNVKGIADLSIRSFVKGNVSEERRKMYGNA